MFRGLYINLDRAVQRRELIERELARTGLADRYARVSGIPREQGTVGCYLSHLGCLGLVAQQQHIAHIIEDDALFTPEARAFLLSERPAALLKQYDMLYLDMWVDPTPQAISRYRAALDTPGEPMNLKGVRVGCVSSYLVTPDSARKLLRLLRDKVPPIDNLIDGLVRRGEINAAVIVPFLTGIDIELGSHSQIQKISPSEQRRYVMMRTSFFVGRARQPSFELPPTAANDDGTD